MADALPTIYFQNTAGLVLQHAAGYAELRYLPGKRAATALAELLTKLGQLLLLRNWPRFLADNREMALFTEAEKKWFIAHWLGHQVPRPTPLLGVVVLPQDVFARLSFMEMYTQAGTSSIRYLTYTTVAEAKAYLAQG